MPAAKTVAGVIIGECALAYAASLVLTYRMNFEEEVRRGGIDGLIARLEQKNRELRSGDGALKARGKAIGWPAT
jgi:hypothetical protein